MEKIVTITYPDSQPALADGIVGKSRRMARSIEALKFRTGADPIDELAMMGTINQAIVYAPEKAADGVYNPLPSSSSSSSMVKSP